MRTTVVVIYGGHKEPKAAATVEVATSLDDRIRGLSGRQYLAPGTGMLFKPASSFWMRDTHIDLDLIYVNNDRISEVIRMEAPKSDDEELKSYRSKLNGCDYAVEFPAGWLASKGVIAGDQIKVKDQI
jgi:uncharacterized membrane protein (UPF0127 family)